MARRRAFQFIAISLLLGAIAWAARTPVSSDSNIYQQIGRDGVVLDCHDVHCFRVLVAIVLMYNGLVRQRNVVDQTWAQIDVQLKRRHDLSPHPGTAVKGSMGFKLQVLTEVPNARAAAGAEGAAGPAAAAGPWQRTGGER